jgi:phosphate starvation-inducible membrane PsiE
MKDIVDITFYAVSGKSFKTFFHINIPYFLDSKMPSIVRFTLDLVKKRCYRL